MREPQATKEIHEIRLGLYEEEKNLTVDEKIAKIKREAKEAIKRYGIKVRRYQPA